MLDHIKTLREQTGAGVMDCKRALEEAGGNPVQATELLRERGLAHAAKRAARETSEGIVEAYVHSGSRVGALVELNCESDFVARTDEFRALAHDLAMQIAAMNPLYLSREDIPSQDGANPEEVCLLEQAFIKDPGTVVRDLIHQTVARVGENIRIRRFSRFSLGE